MPHTSNMSYLSFFRKSDIRKVWLSWEVRKLWDANQAGAVTLAMLSPLPLAVMPSILHTLCSLPLLFGSISPQAPRRTACKDPPYGSHRRSWHSFPSVSTRSWRPAPPEDIPALICALVSASKVTIFETCRVTLFFLYYLQSRPCCSMHQAWIWCLDLSSLRMKSIL